jgi:uncharacterized protein (TIGR03083 family)
MPVGEHIAALRREGEHIVAAAKAGDLDTIVPSCPEWTLRDLVHHTGRVHHWAAAHVERASAEPLTDEESEVAWGPMPADRDVADWYAAANARLVAALEAAPADLVAWSFLPAPSPLAFWARRQAHETAIHRADAELATGGVWTGPEWFALDGIDELLMGFYNRGRRLRSDPPRTLAVTAHGDGRSESWLVHIGVDGPRAERGTGEADGDTGVAAGGRAAADCAIAGPAGSLYLALWNRAGTGDLEITGDATVLDVWTERATVRWT